MKPVNELIPMESISQTLKTFNVKHIDYNLWCIWNSVLMNIIVDIVFSCVFTCCRAAVKMANMDAAFDFMFTSPKNRNGVSKY